MKHRSIIAMATALLCVGMALAAAPSYAGSHATAAQTHSKLKSTSFAFKGSGFGTKVIGGQVPVGSSTTGYQHIGCTNQSGKSRTNDVAAATVPGLGKVSGVKTRVWTTQRHGVTASHATHKIARIALLDSPLGSLTINAISSRSTASHDDQGFHATTTTHLGGLTFTPPIGPAQTFPAPTPDKPITIPGLVTIKAGSHATSHSGTGAVAYASALRIDVIPTGTTVQVAQSHAELDSGMVSGVFSGHANATRVVTALGDILQSGPQPLQPMPCQGTYGHVKQKSLASVDLGGQLVVKGANAKTRGNQGKNGAHGSVRAEVGQVSLGGQLTIDAIVGKATVRREGHKVTMSARGTRVGSITVAGQQQTLPKTGVLEIPGVAKLESNVVKKSHSGMKVVALRITLLDGTGAVINLGEAQLNIKQLP